MSETGQAQSSPISPFRIEPQYVVRIWGYQDLRPWYDHIAQGDPIGEVWLTGDDCVIATGTHAGQTLGSLFAAAPQALLGSATQASSSPLLIKTIFAREKLSVQVHPDDKMAQKYGEPRGKTECWYTLAAEPGAQVAAGLKPGVTLDQVKAQIHDGTLEESLHMVPVEADDMVFVDAGTVHAIWPGSVLLETQQYSDLTYRMFDYGRPRKLHINKSLEATRLTTRAGKIPPKVLTDRTVLIDVEYFRVERVPVTGSRSSDTLRAKGESADGLSYLFAADGAGRVVSASFEPVDLPVRNIIAVPASAQAFVVEDLGGLDLIRIVPNWPAKPV
ncbi:MAG TPA: type I phosphomannose isomerase catalytic subunit [Terracidiphilus sp.]|jgi:mannose-6-phosphate isomerase